MGPIFLSLIFVAMYFVTIRPQQQRLRAQKGLVSSLAVGDEVVTNGGVVGHITELSELELRLDSGGVVLRVARNAVSQRLNSAG